MWGNKMKKEALFTLIKERWKFYLVGYAIGYSIPIIYDGIPNIYYLFPIKMLAIYCALGIGTAYYYGSKQMPIFEGTVRSLKYVIAILVIMIIMYILECVLGNYGIDISPFMGFPKSV